MDRPAVGVTVRMCHIRMMFGPSCCRCHGKDVSLKEDVRVWPAVCVMVRMFHMRKMFGPSCCRCHGKDVSHKEDVRTVLL